MTIQALSPPRFNPHLPYLADSVVSGIMGLACVARAGPITELAGWTLPPQFVLGLGLFLLPWAVINYVTGRMPSPPRSVLLGNMAVDATWVLGSVAIMFITMPSLSGAGWALLIIQALGVLSMFAVKLAGLGSFPR